MGIRSEGHGHAEGLDEPRWLPRSPNPSPPARPWGIKFPISIGIVLAAFVLVLGAGVIAGEKDKPASTQPAASQPNAPARFTLSSKDTEESLQKYVGQVVIVSGIWGGPGKPGNCIRAEDEKGGEPIYVTASKSEAIRKLNWVRPDYGVNVELRGVLHFYKMKPIPPRPPGDNTPQSQPAETHFYFDIEDVSFRFPKK